MRKLLGTILGNRSPSVIHQNTVLVVDLEIWTFHKLRWQPRVAGVSSMSTILHKLIFLIKLSIMYVFSKLVMGGGVGAKNCQRNLWKAPYTKLTFIRIHLRITHWGWAFIKDVINFQYSLSNFSYHNISFITYIHYRGTPTIKKKLGGHSRVTTRYFKKQLNIWIFLFR